MTQRWAFAPHIHAAVDSGNLVLLDTEADAYFCLPGLGAGIPPGPMGDDLAGLSEALIEELAAARLVRRTSSPAAPPPAVIAPAADLADARPDRIGPRDAADLAAAWFWLAPRYYRRPFPQVLQAVRERRDRRAGPNDPAAIHARAALFNALLPWSPVQGACLLQAAWLITFLGRAGHAADWVFGVRTWPFSAHCWVQAGAVVLNDTLERVAPYRVILKV